MSKRHPTIPPSLNSTRPNNGTRPEKNSINFGQLEEKRPSVFERLGSRRDYGGIQPSQIEPTIPNNTIREVNKYSEKMGSSVKRRSRSPDHDKDKRNSRERKRSRSSSQTDRHKKIKSNRENTVDGKDRSFKRHYEKGKSKKSESGSKISGSHEPKSKDRRKGHEEKNGSKGGKNRSSSVSSAVSSLQEGETTSTTVSSSSSVSDISSSTTSEGETSSSESSCPSVKLKPEKRNKKGKREGKGRSGTSKNKSKTSDSGDLDDKKRNYGQAGKSQRDVERSKTDFSKTRRESPKPKDGSKNFNLEEKKRRYSGDLHGGPSNKIRRLDSPSPKGKKFVPRRSPSPRRMIRDGEYIQENRKNKQSPPRDRRSGRSPQYKRQSNEDQPRLDRMDGQKRNFPPMLPTNSFKSKEFDRDRPYSQFGDRYDNKSGYGRDSLNKSRDRYPPRQVPLLSIPTRSVGRLGSLSDFEKAKFDSRLPPIGTGKPQPLLPNYPGKSNFKPMNRLESNRLDRPSRDRDSGRHGVFEGGKKLHHSPMIVKTKEALMEKYEEMNSNKNRANLWTDDGTKGEEGEIIKVRKVPVKDESRVKDKKYQDRKSRASREEKEVGDVFSDFSDDSDDLMTNKETDLKSTGSIHSSSEKPDDISQSSKVQDEEEKPVSIKSVHTASNDPKEGTKERSSVASIKDSRILRNSQSVSQGDDDILKRFGDLDDISDEEDIDGEREVKESKVKIVDALGVDWSLFVCREKCDTMSVCSNSSTSQRARDRWTPLEIFKQVGISKQLCGDLLFQKVVEAMKEEGTDETQIASELQNPILRQKRLERIHLLEDFGVGPCSRALSARRDVAVRRYLLKMPAKSLLQLDMIHHSSNSLTNNFHQESEVVSEFYKMSVALFQGQ